MPFWATSSISLAELLLILCSSTTTTKIITSVPDLTPSDWAELEDSGYNPTIVTHNGRAYVHVGFLKRNSVYPGSEVYVHVERPASADKEAAWSKIFKTSAGTFQEFSCRSVYAGSGNAGFGTVLDLLLPVKYLSAHPENHFLPNLLSLVSAACEHYGSAASRASLFNTVKYLRNLYQKLYEEKERTQSEILCRKRRSESESELSRGWYKRRPHTSVAAQQGLDNFQKLVDMIEEENRETSKAFKSRQRDVLQSPRTPRTLDAWKRTLQSTPRRVEHVENERGPISLDSESQSSDPPSSQRTRISTPPGSDKRNPGGSSTPLQSPAHSLNVTSSLRDDLHVNVDEKIKALRERKQASLNLKMDYIRSAWAGLETLQTSLQDQAKDFGDEERKKLDDYLSKSRDEMWDFLGLL